MVNKASRSKPAPHGRIPGAMTEAHIDRLSVCFYHFNESAKGLEDVPHDFFIRMIRQFKMMASMTWDQIYAHKGLGWDEVPSSAMKWRIPIPTPRERLHHIRVSKRGRVWGYREGDTFYVVWLDPNHEVTP